MEIISKINVSNKKVLFKLYSYIYIYIKLNAKKTIASGKKICITF